ncbi:MAG: glucose 1-dehydrogenase [Chloroflexi bacterium]|nr:glucose 1-dehydrogenase [Chloroflexota bacterium]
MRSSAAGGTLSGRRALVTGAGVGIGLATARALGEAGASVVLHYNSHGEEARAAVAELRTAGRGADAIQADLSSARAVEGLVDRALEALGGLDILVNNAGVTVSQMVERTPVETFDWLYALNVRAMFVTIQRALPALRASGHAAVVNMSSTHGVAGFPGHAAYAATKGAIIALSRELAVELADRSVRVNVIAPGIIEVPRYFDIPGYNRELGDKMVPIGRVGLPEDVAAAVVFLASDAASFITGQTLLVDGGASAQMALRWERRDISGE